MTETKTHSNPEATNGVQNLKSRVLEIQNLENQIIQMKRSLLLEEARSDEDVLEEELNFLVLKMGGRLFAAPLRYIDEVVEMPALEPLPSPNNTISGLLNYHGTYLAVIDLGALLGSDATAFAPNQALIICHADHRHFALKVDETIEVATATNDDITISEQVLPGILKTSGVLMLENREPAMIIDIAWIAMGAQLANLLQEDAATPARDENR